MEEKRVTTVLDFNRPLYDCLTMIKEVFGLTDKENINISLIHSTRASTYGLERTFELNLSSSLREHKIPTRALLIVRVSEIETRERDSSDPILVDKNIWEEGPDSKENIVYDNRDGSILGGTLNKLIMVLTSEKKSGNNLFFWFLHFLCFGSLLTFASNRPNVPQNLPFDLSVVHHTHSGIRTELSSDDDDNKD